MGKDLYVRNIAPETTEAQLRQLFSVCGKVAYIHMVKEARTGAFAGCAFVKMASEIEARDALVSLDGALLISRTIAVSMARPQLSGPRRANPGRRSRTRP